MDVKDVKQKVAQIQTDIEKDVTLARRLASNLQTRLKDFETATKGYTRAELGSAIAALSEMVTLVGELPQNITYANSVVGQYAAQL